MEFVFAWDSMRCGSHVVSLENRQSEVAMRCGVPQSKTFIGYKRYVSHDEENRESHYDEGILVEEWAYTVNDRLSYILTFEAGRLKLIQSSFIH